LKLTSGQFELPEVARLFPKMAQSAKTWMAVVMRNQPGFLARIDLLSRA
jgi:hypothetical protein